MKRTQPEKPSPLKGHGRLELSWRDNGVVALRDYSELDTADVGNLLVAVTRAGGAVIFGITSDGGAYSVCVLLDNEKLREYPHTPAEFHDLVNALVQELS